MRRDSQRHIALTVCFLLLGGIALWALLPAFEQVTGTQPEQKHERAVVKTKNTRYRFRRIYNGGDVMTANHNTGGMPQVSFRSTSNSYGGGQTLSATGVSGRAMAGYGAAGSALGITLPVMESSKGLHAYGGGGGGGGFSGGSNGGGAGISVSSGGYSGGGLAALPSFAALRASSSQQSAATVVMKTAEETSSSTGTWAAPTKRRVGSYYDEDEEDWIERDDLPSETANIGDIVVIEGVKYRYNGDGEWTVFAAEDLPEADYPIGDTPWLMMLLLAGGATVWRMRRHRRETTT